MTGWRHILSWDTEPDIVGWLCRYRGEFGNRYAVILILNQEEDMRGRVVTKAWGVFADDEDTALQFFKAIVESGNVSRARSWQNGMTWVLVSALEQVRYIGGVENIDVGRNE